MTSAHPFPTVAHPSLEEVGEAGETLRQIYPRTFYPNPGSVRLPLGKTAYWLLGPEEGQKVVLVHGISTPSLIWQYLAPVLANNGFRVLVYDLYGRGYSEAPAVAYDTNLYITQLALLLQHVRFDQVHVVGLSMGGGIAAAFAATFPYLLAGKVTVIASAGLMDIPAKVDPASVKEMVSGTVGGGNIIQDVRKLQSEALPGYTQAVLSSLQEGPIRDLHNAYISISENTNLKFQIIHGDSDNTVAYAFGQRIKALLPDAEFVTISGADHDLVVAEAYHGQVEGEILRFLQ